MERGWWDNPVFRGDPTLMIAWERIVAGATYKETKFISNGQPIVLKRGQLATSVRRLAEEWGTRYWSKSRVQRFLACLESASMIGTDTGTGRLVITVINYDTYQVPLKNSGRQPGHSAGHERDNNEERNNPSKEGGDKSPPFDPKKQVFQQGKELLCRDGHSPNAAGGIINKWLSKYGTIPVLDAICRAHAQGGVFQAVGYIETILQRTAGKRVDATVVSKPNGPAVGTPEFDAVWRDAQ